MDVQATAALSKRQDPSPTLMERTAIVLSSKMVLPLSYFAETNSMVLASSQYPFDVVVSLQQVMPLILSKTQCQCQTTKSSLFFLMQLV